MAKVCYRFYVSGHVQGVWFRASTKQQAQKLGITGSAINLPDGRVEVVAYGDEAQIHALEKWLWMGPEHARVDDVDGDILPDQKPEQFTTG